MSKAKRSPWRIAAKVSLWILIVLIALPAIGIAYGVAKRGWHQTEYLSYPFAQVPVQLPRDFAAHPDFKNEWWYYTGHLTGDDGHKYGFELTFFRIRTANMWHNHVPVWWFMFPHGMVAHLAISDKDGKQHFKTDLLQKNSSDNVGAATDKLNLWLRDWYVREENGKHHLFANNGQIGIDLTFEPKKPATLHGENGYHWKGVDGIPSYYISFTRMEGSGTITLGGQAKPVTGLAWMDHEYSSFRPRESTQGWDWFAIQLDNQREVMLYQMRRRDGGVSTDSTGTLVEPDGTALPVVMPDYQIRSTGNWTSPSSGGRYPMGWVVTLPKVPAELTITPSFNEQEMVMDLSDIVYWEGACDVTGTWAGQPVGGLAYVELTGYTAPVAERF